MTKEELEKEISNLLSCKNCPENKGGYICEKEYEGKCLLQKTQYIKELQKENAELDMKRKAERKIFQGIVEKKNDQLAKATELINLFVQWNYGCCKTPDFKDLVKQAEQFLRR